ncbi:MAG: hypothetical protein ACREUG_14010, partial [Steroidobacteraceae bacterium]
MFPTFRGGSSEKSGASRRASLAGVRRAALLAVALIGALALPAPRPAFAKPELFPRPPQLERDVQFW